MYRIGFYILKAVAHLPFFVLYGVSDIFFLILCYGIGYRKKMVARHLLQAFPRYSQAQRNKIARAFYRHLCDYFIETLKLLCLSDRSLIKRMQIDAESELLLAAAEQSERNIYLVLGHSFNWEWASVWMGLRSRIYCAFYLPPTNPEAAHFLYRIRRGSGDGVHLFSVRALRQYISFVKGKTHSVGMLGDQRPFDVKNTYWCDFLGRKTAFTTSVEKLAVLMEARVFFVTFIRPKRGYYKAYLEEIPHSQEKGQMTLCYARLLERHIHMHPALYLWSHNRWKNR